MSNTPSHTFARARRMAVSSVLAGALVALTAAAASASPLFWKFEWPATDFSKKSVEYSEIISGGPPKDGIPSIDNPKFEPAKNARGLEDTVPVISFTMNGEAKAYPLGILMRHEIVNDKVGGIPVAVTYCPLCNSAIVFDARVDGKILKFGTTGKLRNSDLVMYDRTTESWWQQFLGEAIVGELTGTQLKMLPSRIESFAKFKARFPEGTVLKPAVPFGGRGGGNPYVGYDHSRPPVPLSRSAAERDSRHGPGHRRRGPGLDDGASPRKEADRGGRYRPDLGKGPELRPRQPRHLPGPRCG